MSNSSDEAADPNTASGTAVASAADGPTLPPVGGTPASSAASSPAVPSAGSSIAANSRPDNPLDTSNTEPLLTGIARLKAEQALLRAERKRVVKELKNAEKRRTRLRKRARQLSDADLVAVLQMREATAEQSCAEGNARANPAACSAGAAPANAGAAS